MDSHRVLALANRYRQAANQVMEIQGRIKGTVEWNGAEWKGKRRERFNSDYQETIQAFQRYVRDLQITSDELEKAAVRIEELKKELAKQQQKG
ncbi:MULTISPECIES: WXG100 family type VII secretion target [Aneurinibacillus]|uniref:WXG100 family type VII secretion target n=1 Tax=Aneurinibacillus thermoaerophilus TaxID=143495 RepID=A0A1G8CPT0_ANETH|nr:MULTISPECIES: WXG100 family type VII secretion target [Aneurinibacillus]AMA71859.1 hypothetical protein ACH33_02730 [Aneurinibacillus sp. XH2]MED0677228.1 WXG100 family type VII secretion target [Aneurinibacillus thermoaerophilus]MED0737276.1 WXG100 family type VII secretion target [Aneurinibacillus thermoaerophilus]MED0757909.1 WXG100 family type VII secretion target [Aneurinibacillus thermoaerophilus]MED0761607.1 WXG100 family type VII secretion target [Aneurinibacillus thermoaerophilus]